MTYEAALAEARRVGASKAEGLPLLAQTISVLCLPHPGLNPALVYDGATATGADTSQMIRKGGDPMYLSDLMFAAL